jgi:hypothetical protein
MDDRRIRVRFTAGNSDSSLHHCIQIGYETYPAPYPVSIGGAVSIEVEKLGNKADHYLQLELRARMCGVTSLHHTYSWCYLITGTRLLISIHI